MLAHEFYCVDIGSHRNRILPRPGRTTAAADLSPCQAGICCRVVKPSLATVTNRKATFMSKRSITWYPGHMRSALAALRRVMKGVDLVLEVRDSRVS
jgi:hypothetical protein